MTTKKAAPKAAPGRAHKKGGWHKQAEAVVSATPPKAKAKKSKEVERLEAQLYNARLALVESRHELLRLRRQLAALRGEAFDNQAAEEEVSEYMKAV